MVNSKITLIRKYTTLPIAVGFGISNVDQVKAIAQDADAVVVGSAIVRRVGEFGSSLLLEQKIIDFVQPLVEVVKSL